MTFQVVPLQAGKCFFRTDNGLVDHQVLGVCRHSNTGKKRKVAFFLISLYTLIQRQVGGTNLLLQKKGDCVRSSGGGWRFSLQGNNNDYRTIGSLVLD